MKTFETIFVKNKESGGRLIDKIHVLSYRSNSCTVELRQMKFVAVKVHRHTCKVLLKMFLFDESFKCCDGVKF
jgi:hypothetical protein